MNKVARVVKQAAKKHPDLVEPNDIVPGLFASLVMCCNVFVNVFLPALLEMRGQNSNIPLKMAADRALLYILQVMFPQK